MLKSVALSAMVATLVVLPQSGSADQEFHSVRLPLLATGAVGHPELRSGHVMDIHSDGDSTAGHELYMVNGAAPNTGYSVVLDLNLSGCGGPGPMLPFANGVVVTTDDRGNGTGSVFLSQEDLTLVVGFTLGISWRLVVNPTIAIEPTTQLPIALGGTTAYTTGACIPVFIDNNQNGQP
jgi:hypothetical protein